MIIACPDCSTGYLLPEHLVGPGGARVRCPRCQHLFAVGLDGLPLPAPQAAGATASGPSFEAQEAAAASPAATTPEPGSREEPGGDLAVAQAVLEQLAAHEGAAIERARAERRFFAEFGPALMVAYETYRRRAGEDADPSAFRTALRERWGVELVSLAAREG